MRAVIVPNDVEPLEGKYICRSVIHRSYIRAPLPLLTSYESLSELCHPSG
jgi:hypothetical protein